MLKPSLELGQGGIIMTTSPLAHHLPALMAAVAQALGHRHGMMNLVHCRQQVGELSDERWRPPPPGVGSRHFQAGQAFRYALPGPTFADFSGPGGEAAKKGERYCTKIAATCLCNFRECLML